MTVEVKSYTVVLKTVATPNSAGEYPIAVKARTEAEALVEAQKVFNVVYPPKDGRTRVNAPTLHELVCWGPDRVGWQT